MNTRRSIIVLLATLITLTLIAAGPGFAQGIKDRMKARIPAITSMKQAATIGENNNGYLSILNAGVANKAVVDAENKDRKAVYGAIAKQNSTTPDLVGKRRAIKLSGIAKPGEMVQNASGGWVKK